MSGQPIDLAAARRARAEAKAPPPAPPSAAPAGIGEADLAQLPTVQLLRTLPDSLRGLIADQLATIRREIGARMDEAVEAGDPRGYFAWRNAARAVNGLAQAVRP